MAKTNMTMAEVVHDTVIPLPRFHEAAKRLAIQSTTRTPQVLLDDDEQGMEVVQALSTHIHPLLLLGGKQPKELYERILAAAKVCFSEKEQQLSTAYRSYVGYVKIIIRN